MENLDLNSILNRNKLEHDILTILDNIGKSDDISTKRGIYLHGDSGIGKTTFVLNLLKNNNYDTIYYDGSDLRNKTAIETIADNNISKYNVSKLLTGEQKQIVIVMDDVETMNTGDKGGINALSKLIRPKKTKKQRLELKTTNPIICICNNQIDKKIKEIMKGCHVMEILSPSKTHIRNINKLINNTNIDDTVLDEIKGDLRKFSLYLKNKVQLNATDICSNNYDVKIIVNYLINNNCKFDDHNYIINDTDRTIVALIYHENLAFILNKLSPEKAIDLYQKILKIICYADYLDRTTFQKQIWQFNEISSLLKTMYVNNILHKELDSPKNYIKQNDIMFTKVLTKYSSEYNNYTFFQQIAFKLNMEFDEILIYFKSIQENIEKFYDLFEAYEISEVDISRLYRYIDNIENYELK